MWTRPGSISWSPPPTWSGACWTSPRTPSPIPASPARSRSRPNSTACWSRRPRASTSHPKRRGPGDPLARPHRMPSLPRRGSVAGGDEHLHLLVAFHEERVGALGLLEQPNLREALENLFPDDRQLQLRQAIAHAAVDAEAERQVLARAGPVDDVGVGVLDDLLVTVARDVPH